MWVEYYQLPKNAGICCEHCGTYIRNVFVLHFDDGFSLKCGVECYNKLIKQSNISQYSDIFGVYLHPFRVASAVWLLRQSNQSRHNAVVLGIQLHSYIAE